MRPRYPWGVGTSGPSQWDLRHYPLGVLAARLAIAAQEALGLVEVTEMMFWYGGSGLAFWQVALMWAGMIAFWGLLIWAAYALITGARKPGTEHRSDTQHGADARRILDERLARGEIDTEEYRRLREVLASGDGRSPAGTGSGR